MYSLYSLILSKSSEALKKRKKIGNIFTGAWNENNSF